VPALAYNVAYAVNSLYVQSAPGYVILSHIRNLLVNVNSAVNFILYCAVGQKFRRVFLQTFCPFCRQDTSVLTQQHTGFVVDHGGDCRQLVAMSSRRRHHQHQQL